MEIFKWIKANQLKTNKGQPIEFDDHGFLWDFLADDHDRIVVRKCTQIGASFSLCLKLLFYGTRKPLSIIYTLPTSGLMKDFVVSKFDPIITTSLLSNLVPKDKFTKKSLYSVSLKRIADSHFFFKSSWSERAAQAIDSDIVVIDELDFQNPEVRKMYEERTEGSGSLNKIFWIGTPTLPNYGISQLFEESDQRFWWIRCDECKKIQTLEWPANISFKKRAFICKYCRHTLSDNVRKVGKWIPKYPGRRIHGYHFNKLMAPWITAEKLIEDYKKSKPKHFHNFSLGLPYLEKRYQFPKDAWLERLVDESQTESIKRALTILGIDQGSNFHVSRVFTDGQYVVSTVNKVLYSPDELEKEIEISKPDLFVMDRFPDQHYSRKLQEKYGRDKFILVNQKSFWNTHSKWWEFDRLEGIVTIDRTEALENFFDRLWAGELVFLKTGQNIDMVFNHIQNIVPDIGDKYGFKKKIYKTIGPDHFVHAANYALLGAEMMTEGLTRKLKKDLEENKELNEPIVGTADWIRSRMQREMDRLSGDIAIIEPTPPNLIDLKQLKEEQKQ